jgi:hypothetical protein
MLLLGRKQQSFFFEQGKTVRQEPHSTLLPNHPTKEQVFTEKREKDLPVQTNNKEQND